jgi:hypothetical protein
LPRGEDNRLPPRRLTMDVTITLIHDRYGRTTLHTDGPTERSRNFLRCISSD